MPDAAQPTLEATLFYSEPLLRRVVFAFWRRTVGIGLPLVLVGLGISIAVGAYFYGMNWFLALVASLVILGTLLIVAIFITHYRHTLARFRRLKAPTATLVADCEQLTVTSDLGSSTIAWRVISEVWQFPEFWLVMFSRSQFMTLPLEGLSSELREFILERVAESRSTTE